MCCSDNRSNHTATRCELWKESRRETPEMNLYDADAANRRSDCGCGCNCGCGCGHNCGCNVPVF